MARGPLNTAKEFNLTGHVDETLLGVLNVIDSDSRVSQRKISRELGVALGLANSYVTRCVRKGFIKIRQVPKRRYAYYLTPQGFAEKARLTGEYLSVSLSFFRTAREQISELLAGCAVDGHRRVALAGASDLAEVARLCAFDHKIQIVGVVDATQAGMSFHGLPIFASLNECKPVDAVIVTGLIKPEAIVEALSHDISPERILAPRLLRLKTQPPSERKVAAE